jgi:hypothetical protein
MTECIVSPAPAGEVCDRRKHYDRCGDVAVICVDFVDGNGRDASRVYCQYHADSWAQKWGFALPRPVKRRFLRTKYQMDERGFPIKG